MIPRRILLLDFGDLPLGVSISWGFSFE